MTALQCGCAFDMIETCSRKKLRSLRHDSTSALLNPNAATTATAKSGDNRKRQRTEEDKDIYSKHETLSNTLSAFRIVDFVNTFEYVSVRMRRKDF